MHKAPFPATTSFYLTFSILLLLAVSSLSPCVKGNRLIHSYRHLEGDVRMRRFFSASHYFLSIERSGQVRGTRRFSSNTYNVTIVSDFPSLQCGPRRDITSQVMKGSQSASMGRDYCRFTTAGGSLKGEHWYKSAHIKGGTTDCQRKLDHSGIFQVYSISVGVVAMHSAGTGLYIAMDRKGRPYGVKEYGPNCEFQERIEENGYNSYSSARWRHNGNFMYLALRGNGLARLGSRTRHTHHSTHFLPVSI